MAKDDLLGKNQIEDVCWLCSLSEAEIDMLISLKTLVLKRSKVIGHEALAKKFDLKMLRVLSFILMEHFKGRVQDLSITDLAESAKFLDGCNFVKSSIDEKFATMSKEELKEYVGTEQRKRLTEMFSEDVPPNKTKKTGAERSIPVG